MMNGICGAFLPAVLFVLALSGPSATAESSAAPAPEMRRGHAAMAVEVGGGETARRAEILRQFYGTRTQPSTRDAVEIRADGSQLVVSGPVEDVSRVESYLRIDGPRIPRLCTVRHRPAGEVAERVAPVRVAEAVENGYVAFPNNEEATVYLVANDEATLDELERRVREVDYEYVAADGTVHPVERRDPGWLEHVRFGGSVSFEYVYYKDVRGRHYDGYTTSALVGVAVGRDNTEAAVSVGGRRRY